MEIKALTENELSNDIKLKLDEQIDRIILRHKDNRHEINKLVFESVSALTISQNCEKELSSQGILKRFWNGITGKNRELQRKIDKNLAAAQYASQHTLQKLAEQNLMSFELITAVNNKLNASILEVEEEINKIYGTLVVFFKKSRSEIVQLEKRVEKLENNVNLLTWVNSIEYQMWNGVEYTDLNAVEKIACIVDDFRNLTHGNYSTSDLLLLKTAITSIGLNVNEIIKYRDVIFEIEKNDAVRKKIFGEKLENPYIEDWSVVIASGVNKLEKLRNEEKYLFDGFRYCLKEHSIEMSDDEIVVDLLDEYFKSGLLINKNGSVSIYDLIIELLYNIEQLGFVPDKTNEEKLKEAENLFLAGKNKEAYDIFIRLAEDGVPRAMFFVGEFLKNGYAYANGIDYDKKRGYEWQRKGASIGDPLCILNTAYEHEYGSDERNKIIYGISDVIRDMAESGDVFAQNELADITEDEEELKWLQKSSDAGYARSLYKIGRLYYYGEIVEKNYEKALVYFFKAVDKEDALSMGYIGLMYDWGYVFQDNGIEAKKWYKKAAENGAVFAMRNYASTLYNGGKFGDINKEEAKKWYEKAAILGDSEAKQKLEELSWE